MHVRRAGSGAVAALVALTLTGVVSAQANCALRNPDRQIYEIFPEASSYRTLTATVDDQLKGTIEQQVGSDLAQTDLGKHTVYLVLRDTAPVGFVHARTEVGTRGSVELVWALDLDLRIKDFRIQRSRERNTNVIESDTFRDRIVGSDLGAIRTLLTTGNDAVNLSALGVPAEARSIAHTVVLCALKTRVITQTAFTESVHAARMLGHVYRAFPSTASVTKAALSDAAIESGREQIGGGDPPIDVASCTILRSIGSGGESLGSVVFATWSEHPDQPETWWFVNPEGSIMEVRVTGGQGDLSGEFSRLAGATLEDLSSPADDLSARAVRCARFILGVLPPE